MSANNVSFSLNYNPTFLLLEIKVENKRIYWKMSLKTLNKQLETGAVIKILIKMLYT